MKSYKVKKYTNNGSEVKVGEYGILPEEDVKPMLKGYKYDADLEMWFSPKANIGYSVEEVTA